MSPNKTLNALKRVEYIQSAFKDLITSDRLSASDKLIIFNFIEYLTDVHELDYYMLTKEMEDANGDK